MNFQDVLRDVHDPDTHQLKTTTSLSASTVYVGNPTLYAVVNTSVPGISNSIVTVANTPLSTQIIGNVTIDSGNISLKGNITLTDPKTYIGLTTSTLGNTPTVFVGTPTLFAVVNTGAVGIENSMATLNAGPNQIGSVTVSNTVPVTGTFWQTTQPVSGNVGILGNLTISDSKGFIGLTTVNIGSSNTVVLGAGVANFGFATVNQVNQPALVAGAAYIGLASVNIGGSLPALAAGVAYVGLASVNIGGTLPALTPGVANIGFATVSVSNATLYAVVNTGAAGVQNSMVTINPRTDYFGLVSVSGNVAVSALPATPVGANYIGLVSINGSVINLTGTNNIGSVSVLGGVLNTITAVTDITNPIALKGNLTLSDAKTNIGLVTITGGTAWTDPKTYIGLVTITGSLAAASGNVTLDPGSKTGIVGNVTISDSKGFIGLVTVNIGSSNTVVLGSGIANIGFATINQVNQPALVAGAAYIGLASVNIGGSLPALAAGAAYVGLASVNVGGIAAGANYIGLVSINGSVVNLASSNNIGSVSILGGGIGLNAGVNGIGFATVANAAGTQFIGLVTAWTRNAGTTKTLVSLPVAMSTGSVATIAVPTNAQTMYITNLLLNADATVRVNILSGVTYCNGNASIGITLNPGGGWVETGAPDSPTYIGCPSGAIVVQKFDMTATSAKIAGKLVYFQE